MQQLGNNPAEWLDSLLNLPHETEWLELKQAKNTFDFNDLGEYFSALSNEAYLKGHEYGWLIFGVRNDRTVCGTAFRSNPTKLHSLKHEVAAQTSNHLTFEEIHEVAHADGRVVMFQIPSASPGIPTAWKGHWYGRDGESIVPLNLSELERIRWGSTGATEIDRFENYIMDYENWTYDGIDTAVYLPNADYVMRIEEAEQWYGAGNYWWGNLSHEKPIALWYKLMCKRQEVHKVLVFLFANECLKIPLPSTETIAYPDANQLSEKTEFCADVFYYQRDSLEHKLLYHIRGLESRAAELLLSSPIKSQTKPPIVELPFPFVENKNEADALLIKVTKELNSFQLRYASEIATISGGDTTTRMKVERLFSWWVHRLWENEQHR